VIRSFASQTDSAKDSTSAGSDEDAEVPKRREPHPPNKAGLNRFTWDLRYQHPVDFQDMVLWAGLPSGPRVVPGTYAVRLTVNGHSQTQRFVLKADPRSKATQAELASQLGLLTRISDTISAANNAVRTIRNLRRQFDARAAQLPAAKATEYRTMAAALEDNLSRVEGAIYQVRSRAAEDPLNYPIRLNDKLAELLSYVDNGNSRPTAQDHAVFRDLATQLARQLDAMHVALRGLGPVNALLRDAGLAEIVPSTEEPTKAEERTRAGEESMPEPDEEDPK
jgi:hypothetical protein